MQQKTKKIKVKQLQGSDYCYSLSDKLGAGCFAEVYRCYNRKNLDEELAIKIISLKALREASKDKQKIYDKVIKTEFEVLKRIQDNQNLINYKKIDIRSDNHIYLIMEYCNGGDLNSYLQKKQSNQLSEREIKNFIQQFVNGYKELRDKKIVHRDLKLSNILMHNNLIKIGDFGLALLTEKVDDQQSAVLESKNVGNLETKAPELYQISNYKAENLDFAQCDVFSFGVMIYQLMYSNEKEHPMEIIHPYLHKSKSKVPDIQTFTQTVLKERLQQFGSRKTNRSTELKQFVSKLVDKNPNNRPTWEQIFKDDIVTQSNDLATSKFIQFQKNEKKPIKINLEQIQIDFQSNQQSTVILGNLDIDVQYSENSHIIDEELEIHLKKTHQKDLKIMNNGLQYHRQLFFIIDKTILKLVTLLQNLLVYPLNDPIHQKNNQLQLQQNDGLLKRIANVFLLTKFQKQNTQFNIEDLTDNQNKEISQYLQNHGSSDSLILEQCTKNRNIILQIFKFIVILINLQAKKQKNFKENLLQNLKAYCDKFQNYSNNIQKTQNQNQKQESYEEISSSFFDFFQFSQDFKVAKQLLQCDFESTLNYKEILKDSLKYLVENNKIQDNQNKQSEYIFDLNHLEEELENQFMHFEKLEEQQLIEKCQNHIKYLILNFNTLITPFNYTQNAFQNIKVQQQFEFEQNQLKNEGEQKKHSFVLQNQSYDHCYLQVQVFYKGLIELDDYLANKSKFQTNYIYIQNFKEIERYFEQLEIIKGEKQCISQENQSQNQNKQEFDFNWDNKLIQEIDQKGGKPIIQF